MNLQTIPYTEYEPGLPQEGNFILAQTTKENITVYQAFNKRIADYAISHQQFGGTDYSFCRMTWIKPNFLWMMYRSGWAEKENQDRILAVDISLAGFYTLLEQGVLTSHKSLYGIEQSWRQQLNASDVRIQWDPDHDAQGVRLNRRALQIGIKAMALQKFNVEFVKSISDITDFVKEQKKKLDRRDDNFLVMKERVVDVSAALKEKFSIPASSANKSFS